jgi:tRNA modification GTPase
MIIHATDVPLGAGGISWAINERQSEALQRTKQALNNVIDSMEAGVPLDCWTVDLRQALLALGEVTGDSLTEELLQGIFSTFCIGK